MPRPRSSAPRADTGLAWPRFDDTYYLLIAAYGLPNRNSPNVMVAYVGIIVWSRSSWRGMYIDAGRTLEFDLHGARWGNLWNAIVLGAVSAPDMVNTIRVPCQEFPANRKMGPRMLMLRLFFQPNRCYICPLHSASHLTRLSINRFSRVQAEMASRYFPRLSRRLLAGSGAATSVGAAGLVAAGGGNPPSSPDSNDRLFKDSRGDVLQFFTLQSP